MSDDFSHLKVGKMATGTQNPSFLKPLADAIVVRSIAVAVVSGLVSAAGTLTLYSIVNQQTLAWLTDTSADVKQVGAQITESQERWYDIHLETREQLAELRAQSSAVERIEEGVKTNEQKVSILTDEISKFKSDQALEMRRVSASMDATLTMLIAQGVIDGEPNFALADDLQALRNAKAMGGSDFVTAPNFPQRFVRNIPKEAEPATIEAISQEMKKSYAEMIANSKLGYDPNVHSIRVEVVETKEFGQTGNDKFELWLRVVYKEGFEP